MKKMIATGLLAVCWIAASQHEASAWVNSRFGIGMNWDLQSANNSLVWGLVRNGQIPAPEMSGGGMPYGAPNYAPAAQAYPPQGYAPQGYAPKNYSPQTYAPQGFPPANQAAGFEPYYANPSSTYPAFFQFTNNPGQYYYYPATSYGR